MTSDLACRVAWIATLSLMACGGRSGLEPFDASRAPTDYGMLSDAGLEPDDGGIACPARSDVGFRLVALEPPALGFVGNRFSVGGDGSAVYLIAEESLPGLSVLHVYALDGPGWRARELGTVPSFGLARITVDDGVGRVVGIGDGTVGLVEVRGDEVRELGRTEFYHSTRFVPARPAWNGTDLIVTGSPSAGSPGFFGPLVPGAESTPWATLDGASMAIVAQPETGITRLATRAWDERLTYQTFDREGVPLTPVVPLLEPGRMSGFAFGWLDDGTEQPIVVAAIQPIGASYRAVLQRYRLDGTRAGGFSAPLRSGPSSVDLTTVPAPPLASGYGMVVAGTDGALFHGAGRDFVGDASELPVPCARATIAAGPCGYVIACQSGEGPQLALAIPPERR